MESERTAGEFCQAIIENVMLLKDGSVVAGSNVVSGTVTAGQKLYYVDCVGRQCFPVTVGAIALPGKGGTQSISAGSEGSGRAALKLEGCRPENLHAGHVLQSEPEEVVYAQAPGWDAITAAFAKRYPKQIPAHFGAYANFKPVEMGPLDGISVYNGGEYFHFVTYGLSELYEKQNGNPTRSGYGFELTFKLRREGLKNPALEVRHVCSLLQMVAGATVDNGHQFLPDQFLMTGQNRGMDAMRQSALTGFITQEDELGTLDTPFGKVQLVQLIGVTQEELEKMKRRELTPQQLAQTLEGGVTDYLRK